MKIEKNFYDIMMQECDEIEAEIELEESLLSDEERYLQKVKSSQEAQNIINLANEKIHRTWHVHNARNVEAFNIIYDRVLEFAEANYMNVLIETDSTTGKIRLTTPFIHSELLSTKEDKKVLMALIEISDDFVFEAENGLLRLDFYFNLTTPVEK